MAEEKGTEDAPAEDSGDEETPTENSGDEETRAGDSSAEDSSAEDSSAEDSSAEDSSAEDSSADDSGAKDSGEDAPSDSSGDEDLSNTTAPSIGPGTTFKREPVEERLARHDQSNVDAMGQDKRREVVGHSYGPSFARQAVLYLVFLLVIAALAFGVKLLVDKYDQPPKHFKAEAAWAQPGVKQIPPKPLQ